MGTARTEGLENTNHYIPGIDRAGIAIGITNYGHEEVTAIRGVRSDRIARILGHQYGAEVVHRNNLVLL